MDMKQVQSIQQYPILTYAGIGVSIVAIIATIFYFFAGVQQSDASEKQLVIWTGAESSSWSDTSNWLLGEVPTENEHVMIPKEALNSPIVASSQRILLDALTISSGANMDVRGMLQVENDLIVESKGSHLDIHGSLQVKKNLYVKLRSVMTVMGDAEVSVGENLDIEWAELHNSGTLNVSKDFRLKRRSSKYLAQSGTTQIKGDLHLQSSSSEGNQFLVTGGIVEVEGKTKFYKLYKGQGASGDLRILDGRLSLYQMGRDESNPATLAESYSIHVAGGELIFKGDALFDTLSADDSLIDRRLGFSLNEWDSQKTYARQEPNEIIEVLFNDYVFWLSQDIWWSKGDHPETASSWVNLGKSTDLHPGKNCGQPEWEIGKVYNRSTADEEIYVTSMGMVYRMNKACWYSKDNAPEKNDWAWTPTYDCAYRHTVYRDQIIVKRGQLVFEAKATFPSGFVCAPEGRIVLRGSGIHYEPGTQMQFGNLVIESGSFLQEGATITVASDFEDYNGVKAEPYSVKLNGRGDQQITGAKQLSVHDLILEKDSGGVYLKSNLVIRDSIHWLSNTVLAPYDRSKAESSILLLFGENTGYTGDGWYEGKIVKKGSSTFVFPLGQNGKQGFVEISETDVVGTYAAEYKSGSGALNAGLERGLKKVSSIEHWVIEAVSGTSEVWPTLYWQSGNASGIEKPKDLVVAQYANGEWTSLGQRFNKGGSDQGSVTADKRPSSLGILTFGTKSMANTLSIDKNPEGSIGSHISEHSSIAELVDKDSLNNEFLLSDNRNMVSRELRMDAYPNPIVNHFQLSLTSPIKESGRLTVYNAAGMEIYSEQLTLEGGENKIGLNGQSMMPHPGNYILLMHTGTQKTSLMVVKQ